MQYKTKLKSAAIEAETRDILFGIPVFSPLEYLLFIFNKQGHGKRQVFVFGQI